MLRGLRNCRLFPNRIQQVSEKKLYLTAQASAHSENFKKLRSPSPAAVKSSGVTIQKVTVTDKQNLA